MAAEEGAQAVMVTPSKEAVPSDAKVPAAPVGIQRETGSIHSLVRLFLFL